jgi:hypothetical protein
LSAATYAHQQQQQRHSTVSAQDVDEQQHTCKTYIAAGGHSRAHSRAHGSGCNCCSCFILVYRKHTLIASAAALSVLSTGCEHHGFLQGVQCTDGQDGW